MDTRVHDVRGETAGKVLAGPALQVSRYSPSTLNMPAGQFWLDKVRCARLQWIEVCFRCYMYAVYLRACLAYFSAQYWVATNSSI